MGSTTPYQFIRRGQLFVIPVAPSIAEVPYPTQAHTKPKEFSLWVNGRVEEPAFQLDHPRMPPSMYQEVRDDLVRYSPVEVSRSSFRRSNHAYVGVIDSKGTPYYFTLDSRGLAVREVSPNDDNVWKTFDRLSEEEHMTAVRLRRQDSVVEMTNVDRELSTPVKSLRKALPKKSKEKPVKKTPSKKVATKKVGATGKPRYTYPKEKAGASKKPGAKKPGASTAKQQPQPLIVAHDDRKHADPAELANQLNVSVRTIQHVAKRLGRDEFVRYMRSHLKRFSAKHRLDPDYWGTIYVKLQAAGRTPEIDASL